MTRLLIILGVNHFILLLVLCVFAIKVEDIERRLKRLEGHDK